MPTVQRTVTTTAPPTRVLPYLLDFENAPEWDSGTVTCELISGDGSVGTVWHNVSKFAGRTVDLDYTMESISDHGFRHRGAQRDHHQPRHDHRRPPTARARRWTTRPSSRSPGSAGGCGRWRCRC